MIKSIKRCLLLLFLCAVFSPVYGQITVLQKDTIVNPNPDIFHFSGQITEAMKDGNYDFSIQIDCTTNDSSDKKLWKETLRDVPVKNGFFNITIGRTKALLPLYSKICLQSDKTFNSPYVLTVKLTINSEEKTVSFPLTSVPYAFKSKIADWSQYAEKVIGKIVNEDISDNTKIDYSKLDISKGNILSLLALDEEGIDSDKTYTDLTSLFTDIMPSEVIQKNDNISLLTNDSLFVTANDIPTLVSKKALIKGNDISLLNNDSEYLTMPDVNMSKVTKGILPTQYGGLGHNKFNNGHFIYYDGNKFISDDVPSTNYLRNDRDSEVDKASFTFTNSSLTLDKNSSFSIDDIISFKNNKIDISKSATLNVEGASSLANVKEIIFSDGTTLKSAKLSVDTNSIADGAVTTKKLADNAITADKITANAIVNSKIANNAVTLEKLDFDKIFGHGLEVSSDKIQIKLNGESLKLSDDGLSVNEITTDLINGLGKLATKDTIDDAKLIEKIISSDHIKDGAIESKHIAKNTITSVNIAENAVTDDQLADNAVDTGALQDNSVTTDKIKNDAITSDKIIKNAVVNDKIKDSAVTFAKLNTDSILGNGFKIDSSKVALKLNGSTLALSSDGLSINEIGVKLISDLGALGTKDKIDNSNLIDKVISSDHIKDGAIQSKHIAKNTITSVNIAENAVTDDELADNAVDTDAIQDNAVTTEKLASDLVLDGSFVIDGDTRDGKKGTNAFYLEDDLDNNDKNDREDASDDAWVFKINDTDNVWITEKALSSNIDIISSGTITGKKLVYGSTDVEKKIASIQSNQETWTGKIKKLTDGDTVAKKAKGLIVDDNNSVQNKSDTWLIKAGGNNVATVNKTQVEATAFKGDGSALTSLNPANITGVSESGNSAKFLNQKGKFVGVTDIKVDKAGKADSVSSVDAAAKIKNGDGELVFDSDNKLWQLKVGDTVVVTINAEKGIEAIKFTGDGSGLVKLDPTGLNGVDKDGGDTSEFLNETGRFSTPVPQSLANGKGGLSYDSDNNIWEFKVNDKKLVFVTEKKVSSNIDIVTSGKLVASSVRAEKVVLDGKTVSDDFHLAISWKRDISQVKERLERYEKNYKDFVAQSYRKKSEDVVTGNIFIATSYFRGNLDGKDSLLFKIDNKDKMIIDSDGNVGIGVDQPAVKLHVNGKVKATNVASSSDKRLKKNIKSESNILSRILNLTVKTFHLNTQKNSENKQYGFIAQDVKTLFPELVFGKETKKTYLSLAYDRFGVLAIGAIQELKREKDLEIEQLNKETRLLEKELSHLNNIELNELETENERMENEIKQLSKDVKRILQAVKLRY